MTKWKEKSNNEILTATKEMQEEHEKIKADIMVLVEKMEAVEREFSIANNILLDRLKGNTE